MADTDLNSLFSNFEAGDKQLQLRIDCLLSDIRMFECVRTPKAAKALIELNNLLELATVQVANVNVKVLETVLSKCAKCKEYLPAWRNFRDAVCMDYMHKYGARGVQDLFHRAQAY